MADPIKVRVLKRGKLFQRGFEPWRDLNCVLRIGSAGGISGSCPGMLNCEDPPARNLRLVPEQRLANRVGYVARPDTGFGPGNGLLVQVQGIQTVADARMDVFAVQARA